MGGRGQAAPPPPPLPVPAHPTPLTPPTPRCLRPPTSPLPGRLPPTAAARDLRRDSPGSRGRRGCRGRHCLQLGPLLSAVRSGGRTELRVLVDAGRLGRADEPGRDQRSSHL